MGEEGHTTLRRQLQARPHQPTPHQLQMGNGSGDVRRALEACAQAIEIVAAEAGEAAAAAAAHRAQQQQQKQQPTQQKQQPMQQQQQQQEASTPAPAPAPPRTVGLCQMAAALSRVTGGWSMWDGVCG